MAVDHVAAQTAHCIFINYIRIWTMNRTGCRAAEVEDEISQSNCVCIPVCVYVQLVEVYLRPIYASALRAASAGLKITA